MARNRNGTGSDPRLSQKLRAAIANLIEGRARTQGEAAKLAGYSGPQFSRSLKKAHVQRFLLSEATKHLRGVPAALAAARLSDLLHSKSDDVSARVASSIARSAGIIAPDGPQPSSAALSPGPVLTVVFNRVQPSAEMVAAGAIAPAQDRIPARVEISAEAPPVIETVAEAPPTVSIRVRDLTEDEGHG